MTCFLHDMCGEGCFNIVTTSRTLFFHIWPVLCWIYALNSLLKHVSPIYSVESNQDPTAHAEMICIRNAAKLLGGWRLLVTN